MKCTTRWPWVLRALLALVVLGTAVGHAWADTFRVARVPLEATVLDEVTGETVEIEATLRVVVRCGSNPRVSAVVIRQSAVGASGRDYVFIGADRAALAGDMSLGGDQFVHAPNTGDVVKISSLNEPFYAGQFAGARRVA